MSSIALTKESTSSSLASRPVLAVQHRLERSARGGGDDRPSGRLRLDGGDAELLDARHEHRARARVQLDEILVACPPEELGLGIGLAEGGVIGP